MGDVPVSIDEREAIKDAPRSDASLDKSIEDSFPASDPPAVTQPANPPQDAQTGDEDEGSAAADLQACLDESLEDTFPASDPPALTQPPGEAVGAPPRPEPEPDEPRVADFLKRPIK